MRKTRLVMNKDGVRAVPDPSNPENALAYIADKRRLDWMEQMRNDCEGHVLTRCFIPGPATLRQNIDNMMALNLAPNPDPRP